MTKRRKHEAGLAWKERERSTCLRKKGYSTEFEASDAIKSCQRHEKGLSLSIYVCPVCFKFHLTQD